MLKRRVARGPVITIACIASWAIVILFTTDSVEHLGARHGEYMALEALAISVAVTLTVIMAVARIARSLSTAFDEGYSSAVADMKNGGGSDRGNTKKLR